MPRPSPQTTRVMSIIGLLTDRGEQGAKLAEIARHVGQTPAACVHVLAALAAGGFVVRHPEDRRYRLGPGLVEPGRVAARRFPALDATRTTMATLARSIGRPVLAFRRDGAYARLVEVVDDLHRPAPSLRIGDLLPIEPPLGAVFVAWGDSASIEWWLSRASHDDGTRDALRSRLAVVRDQGFCVELRPPLPLLHELGRLMARGQDLRRAERLRGADTSVASYLADAIRPGRTYEAASLAVPVFGPDGTVDLALGVMGFAGRHSGRELLAIADHARACADSAGASLRIAQ